MHVHILQICLYMHSSKHIIKSAPTYPHCVISPNSRQISSVDSETSKFKYRSVENFELPLGARLLLPNSLYFILSFPQLHYIHKYILFAIHIASSLHLFIFKDFYFTVYIKFKEN